MRFKKYKIREKSIAYYTLKLIRFLIIYAVIFTVLCLIMSCVNETEQKKESVNETVKEEITAEKVKYIPKEVKEYDVPLDENIKNYTVSICELYGIPPETVFAMMEVESDFQTDAVGDNGNSIGLMQIQPRWNGERMEKLGITNLYNPYNNITVGVDILREKIQAGNGMEWALTAYNGGNARADRYLKNGTTCEYAEKVLRKADEIQYATIK